MEQSRFEVTPQFMMKLGDAFAKQNMMKTIFGPGIEYKSLYSELCKLMHRPLPATQEEEDYYQRCDWENADLIHQFLNEVSLKYKNQQTCLNLQNIKISLP